MKHFISWFFIVFIFANGLVSLYNKMTLNVIPINYNAETVIVDTMWQKVEVKEIDREALPMRLRTYVGIWEKLIVAEPAFHNFYLESYGLLQRLMGRNIMEDANPSASVVRLTTGQLAFFGIPTDYGRRLQAENVEYEIKKMKQFADFVDSVSPAQIYYIVHPSKRGLPYHLVRNPNNEHEDSLFYQALDTLGIKMLNLFDLLPQDPSIAFYNTDHHWKIEYAFSQLPVICRFIEIPDTLYTKAFFKLINTKKEMVGSLTKRTGRLFTPLTDSVKYLEPLFETKLAADYYSHGRIIRRKGTFMQTVMFPEFLDLDPVQTNYYAICNHGDNPMVRITNLSPDSKSNVLIIADSYGAPIIPYLSLMFHHIDCLDFRSNKNNGVYEMIRKNRYDKIIFIYLGRSETMFSFN